MALHIESMTETDFPAVVAIYREGIATGNATFEVDPPDSWEVWCRHKLPCCSLVAREVHDDAPVAGTGSVVGWVALSPVSSRAVYAGVAEHSIYVAADRRGIGIGSRLLDALILSAEAHGIWMLQTSIFPENTASLALHVRHGFRQVGIREGLGLMTYGPYAGRWRDVVFLERRSTVVGVT